MRCMDVFLHRQQRSFLTECRNFCSTTTIRLGSLGQKAHARGKLYKP